MLFLVVDERSSRQPLQSMTITVVWRSKKPRSIFLQEVCRRPLDGAP